MLAFARCLEASDVYYSEKHRIKCKQLISRKGSERKRKRRREEEEKRKRKRSANRPVEDVDEVRAA